MAKTEELRENIRIIGGNIKTIEGNMRRSRQNIRIVRDNIRITSGKRRRLKTSIKSPVTIEITYRQSQIVV